MKTTRLVELIEEIAPSWWHDEDPSGIQVDCGKKNISRVLVCLEINDDIIAEAKRKKVDMIITHHPLLFQPLKRVSADTPAGRYVMALVKAGIGVYSSHLPFDTAVMGNNIYLAKLLGLQNVALPCEWDGDVDEKALISALVPDLTSSLSDDEVDEELLDDDEMYDEDEEDYSHLYVQRISFDGRSAHLFEIENDEETEFEYDVDEVGNIGYLKKPMNFKQFCTHVEKCLDLPKHYIRCVDGGKDKIEKVAFCTGAGGEFVYRAARLGCDAYITGDLKLHEAQYAKAMGLTVIDAGHYGTEKIFTECMAAQLRAVARGAGLKLEVIEAVSNTNPYTL